MFLGMLHKTTYFMIFFFTCILNWKVPTFFMCILVKYLTNSLIHPSKRLLLQWRGNPKGNVSFLSRVNYNSQVIPLISVTCALGVFLRIRIIFFCSAVKIPSPLTKHTRALLTTSVLVLKFLKVILVLYEQFSELSASLHSRYGYGTGCILSGVRVKFIGKNRLFLHNRR
jgi:hypothetical protein